MSWYYLDNGITRCTKEEYERQQKDIQLQSANKNAYNRDLIKQLKYKVKKLEEENKTLKENKL